jgi:hypothetical protein
MIGHRDETSVNLQWLCSKIIHFGEKIAKKSARAMTIGKRYAMS